MGLELSRQERRTPIGQCVCFCVSCRDLRASDAAVVHLAWHLGLVIRLHEGRKVAVEIACKECGAVLGFPATAAVSPVERISVATPPEMLLLAAKTGPQTEEELRRRLQEEEQLIEGTLRAASRTALLEEPFVALAYMNERSYLSGDVNMVTWFFAVPGLMILAVSMVLFYSWYSDPTAARHAIVPWMIGVAAVGLVLASIGFYRILTDRSRVSRRAVLPHLARSLLRLQPKEIDLERTIRKLASAGSPLAQSLTAKSILNEMESIRRGGWTPPRPEEIA